MHHTPLFVPFSHSPPNPNLPAPLPFPFTNPNQTKPPLANVTTALPPLLPSETSLIFSQATSDLTRARQSLQKLLNSESQPFTATETSDLLSYLGDLEKIFFSKTSMGQQTLQEKPQAPSISLPAHPRKRKKAPSSSSSSSSSSSPSSPLPSTQKRQKRKRKIEPFSEKDYHSIPDHPTSSSNKFLDEIYHFHHRFTQHDLSNFRKKPQEGICEGKVFAGFKDLISQASKIRGCSIAEKFRSLLTSPSIKEIPFFSPILIPKHLLIPRSNRQPLCSWWGWLQSSPRCFILIKCDTYLQNLNLSLKQEGENIFYFKVFDYTGLKIHPDSKARLIMRFSDATPKGEILQIRAGYGNRNASYLRSLASALSQMIEGQAASRTLLATAPRQTTAAPLLEETPLSSPPPFYTEQQFFKKIGEEKQFSENFRNLLTPHSPLCALQPTEPACLQTKASTFPLESWWARVGNFLIKIDSYIQEKRSEASRNPPTLRSSKKRKKGPSKPLLLRPHANFTETFPSPEPGERKFFLKLFYLDKRFPHHKTPKVPYDDEALLVIRIAGESGISELTTLKAGYGISGNRLNQFARQIYQLLAIPQVRCHDDSKIRYPHPTSRNNFVDLWMREFRPIIKPEEEACSWYSKFGYRIMNLKGRETLKSKNDAAEKKLESNIGHWQSAKITESAIHFLRHTKVCGRAREASLKNYYQQFDKLLHSKKANLSILAIDRLLSHYFEESVQNDNLATITLHQLAYKISSLAQKKYPLSNKGAAKQALQARKDFVTLFNLYSTNISALYEKLTAKRRLPPEQSAYCIALQILDESYILNLTPSFEEGDRSTNMAGERMSFIRYVQAADKRYHEMISASSSLLYPSDTTQQLALPQESPQKTLISAAKELFVRSAYGPTQAWEIIFGNCSDAIDDLSSPDSP